jgi:hypothetical protein
MSAAFEQYLQPPAPDPDRGPDDTSEPNEPAVEEIDGYLQPPPSNLRPAHDWAGSPSTGPRPWVSKPVGQAIAGFSLSLAGHVLTWTSFSLSMSQFDRWWLPTIAVAAACIVAGIAVSTRARLRYRRGLVGGQVWSGVGLTLGILWVLLAVGLALLFLISGPVADV